jgi:hypothetical protein
MQQHHSHACGPSLTSIELQHCPKCDARMSLASIRPGPSGFDIRKFECAGCHHVQIAIAEADPMKSDAIRWLSGHDLKSPT